MWRIVLLIISQFKSHFSNINSVFIISACIYLKCVYFPFFNFFCSSYFSLFLLLRLESPLFGLIYINKVIKNLIFRILISDLDCSVRCLPEGGSVELFKLISTQMKEFIIGYNRKHLLSYFTPI